MVLNSSKVKEQFSPRSSPSETVEEQQSPGDVIRGRSLQWLSNRGFSRFKEPGPPTVRAPDRGHNLFYLQDARKPGFRRNRNPLIGFLKDAPSAYLVHSYFLFPKTLTDSSDEEIIGNNGWDFCKKKKKYSDDVSDDECFSLIFESLCGHKISFVQYFTRTHLYNLWNDVMKL